MKSRRAALEGRGLLRAVTLVLAVAGCGQAVVNPSGSPSQGSNKGGAGGSSGTADGGSGGDRGFVLPDAAMTEAGPVGVIPPNEQCAEDVLQAKLTPVDLLLLVDASGSMAWKAGERSRWELARDALAAFLGDGRSAGLGVGVQFFPQHVRTCNDDGTCFLPSPGGCKVLSACLAPGAKLVTGAACGGANDEDCPAGTECKPLGKCSATGGDCVGMGTPCPTGVANDVCGARPRQCRLGPSSRGTCEQGVYAQPVVAITDLPAGAPRLVGALDTRLPLGATPLGDAVKGALTHLTARGAANQGRRTALVLVSDGVPEGCNNNNIVTDLQAARMRNPAIPTYVVGVFGDDAPAEARTAMMDFAVAGGTESAFIVSPNEQLTEKFLAALNQIRGAIIPCEIDIPKATARPIDFGRVNVRVSDGGGGRDLVYVERRDRCDPTRGGWYYDVDPKTATPARVHLCEAVCSGLKSDPKAQLELRFGCASRIVE